jgi:hypothetical protein
MNFLDVDDSFISRYNGTAAVHVGLVKASSALRQNVDLLIAVWFKAKEGNASTQLLRFSFQQLSLISWS